MASRANAAAASQPQRLRLSGSLEEKAVRHLGALIAEGHIKNYESVLQYIETTKEAQELHCPVCLELWKSPVKSKCGHIFCEQCIGVWKMRCKRLRIPVQCPCCRADVGLTVQQPVTPDPLKTVSRKHLNSDRTKRARGWLGRQPRLHVFTFLGLCSLLASIAYLMNSFWGSHVEIPLLLPSLTELVGTNGPGVYAFLNAALNVHIQRKAGANVAMNGLKTVPASVPFSTVFYPVGTVLRLADTPDTIRFHEVTQTIKGAQIVEAGGTVTHEVIPNIPLILVSVFGGQEVGFISEESQEVVSTSGII